MTHPKLMKFTPPSIYFSFIFTLCARLMKGNINANWNAVKPEFIAKPNQNTRILGQRKSSAPTSAPSKEVAKCQSGEYCSGCWFCVSGELCPVACNNGPSACNFCPKDPCAELSFIADDSFGTHFIVVYYDLDTRVVTEIVTADQKKALPMSILFEATNSYLADTLVDGNGLSFESPNLGGKLNCGFTSCVYNLYYGGANNGNYFVDYIPFCGNIRTVQVKASSRPVWCLGLHQGKPWDWNEFVAAGNIRATISSDLPGLMKGESNQGNNAVGGYRSRQKPSFAPSPRPNAGAHFPAKRSHTATVAAEKAVLMSVLVSPEIVGCAAIITLLASLALFIRLMCAKSSMSAAECLWSKLAFGSLPPFFQHASFRKRRDMTVADLKSRGRTCASCSSSCGCMPHLLDVAWPSLAGTLNGHSDEAAAIGLATCDNQISSPSHKLQISSQSRKQ